MLLLQKFLRNGGTREQLLELYAINSKQHREYPNLVQFKYNQIDSPMGEKIVQESRGIILDSANNWEIIAWPFHKFFNHGEIHAATIDWSTARVQEKLDGSQIIMYWYDNDWKVATSGTPDASGEVNGFGFTFRELFWKVWKEDMGWQVPWVTHPDAPDGMDKRCTFMWELTTPYNRVVVQHKKNSISLIGCRHLDEGEQDIEKMRGRPEGSFPNPVRSFPLQSMEDIERTFKDMDPLRQEGYVVVDGAFNRVKVKHAGYVAIHHLRDGFGPKRLLEVIRSGEHSELLTYFPEWTDTFNAIKVKYEALVKELEADYERLKDIPVQKDFALEAAKTKMSGCLFALRAKKIGSVRDFLAQMMVKHLMDTLKLKDTEM